MLPKQVVKLRHSIIAGIHNLNLLQLISQYIDSYNFFTVTYFTNDKFLYMIFTPSYQQLVKRFVEL